MKQVKIHHVLFVFLILSKMSSINEFEMTFEDIIQLKDDFKACLSQSSLFKHPNMFQKTFVHDKYSNTTFNDKKILAIDFGGTSLKLGLYQIREGEIVESLIMHSFKIPEKDEISNIDAFEWCADKIHDYLNGTSENIIAGMTFSYPVSQNSLSSVRILNLSKNFHFKEIPLNGDPINLLNEALSKKNMNIKVKGLANDTVSTLMSLKKKPKDHRIGIVLGTGTNASYFKRNGNGDNEAINIEWGYFDSPYLKKNKYDLDFAEELKIRGDKTNNLDKMIGGFGFLHLLNKAILENKVSNKKISLEEVIKIIDKKDEKCQIFQLITNIKKRSMRIISALVLGIIETYHLKNDETITLILNGSIFDSYFDNNLFVSENREILEYNGIDTKKISILTPSGASLKGIVNILCTELMN